MTINILSTDPKCPLAAEAAESIKPFQSFICHDYQLNGSIRLTWVQKLRILAQVAKNLKQPWFTMMHNDARVSVEDIKKMVYAARANRGKFYWTVTYNPELPEQNKDLVAIFDTDVYWQLGGHDSRFDFYYADIDFHKRAYAAGFAQQEVITPSAQHLNGGSTTKKTAPDKYIDIVTEKDRQIFNMLWPDNQM